MRRTLAHVVGHRGAKVCGAAFTGSMFSNSVVTATIVYNGCDIPFPDFLLDDLGNPDQHHFRIPSVLP